jgi:hypothetical protein
MKVYEVVEMTIPCGVQERVAGVCFRGPILQAKNWALVPPILVINKASTPTHRANLQP